MTCYVCNKEGFLTKYSERVYLFTCMDNLDSHAYWTDAKGTVSQLTNNLIDELKQED